MVTKEVLQYLEVKNRPYSANDIATNLGQSKTAVQKSLDSLVEKKKVFEKVYGKQKIYCIVQDSSQDADELMHINRELQSHAKEVETKRAEVDKSISEHEARLTNLRKNPSLEEAIKQRDELRATIKRLSEKLDDLMESNGSAEDLGVEKRKAEDSMKDYSREYSKRKRLCTEIIDCILESYPGSKKELHEEIGIEVKIVQ